MCAIWVGRRSRIDFVLKTWWSPVKVPQSINIRIQWLPYAGIFPFFPSFFVACVLFFPRFCALFSLFYNAINTIGNKMQGKRTKGKRTSKKDATPPRTNCEISPVHILNYYFYLRNFSIQTAIFFSGFGMQNNKQSWAHV